MWELRFDRLLKGIFCDLKGHKIKFTKLENFGVATDRAHVPRVTRVLRPAPNKKEKENMKKQSQIFNQLKKKEK